MNRELLEKLASLERRIGALERQERPVPVVAVYETNAAQSIDHNTETVVNFEDEVIDTHGAVTVGAAWVFTAPLAGYYYVRAMVRFASTGTWAEGEVIQLGLYKNGSGGHALVYRNGLDSSGGAAPHSAGGATVVQLATGDTLAINVLQTSGGPLSLSSNSNYNHISIFRIH